MGGWRVVLSARYQLRLAADLGGIVGLLSTFRMGSIGLVGLILCEFKF